MSLTAEKENTSFNEVRWWNPHYDTVPERWWKLAQPLAHALAARVIQI